MAGDPEALGHLLRSRRQRLTPAEVGLPAGTNRRRTPGLRREEVAQLADVSTTYYSFLEQGRPVRPSAQVLDSLAAALRLSEAERRYLHLLAAVGPAPDGGPEEVDDAVRRLVRRLDPDPALVKGRRWDVLCANAAAAELFRWDGDGPGINLVRWMFTDTRAREVYLDWEGEARAMLGRFRLATARRPDDPEITELVADLHRGSDLVRRWWPQHHVTESGSGTKRLRHPRTGPHDYQHAVLQVTDHPDQTLVAYSRIG